MVWTALLALVAVDARGAMTPAETRDHIGEGVVVEGHLDSVVCSPQACLLSFEPGFSGLIVSIPGDVVERFPDPKGFQGRQVRVRGELTERGGRPRIELRDRSAIEVVDSGSALPAAAPPAQRSDPVAASGSAAKGAAANESAVASKNGGDGPAGGDPSVAANGPRVEVQVEGGPPAGHRVDMREAARKLGLGEPSGTGDDSAEDGGGAAIQAGDEIGLLRQDLAAISTRLGRIEARLDEMEERVADVEGVVAEATAGADDAARGLPSYVVPGQPQLTLHRVGRGWSAERVVRLLGEPLQVIGRPPGPFTWYYDGGRALTVDARGRVLSAVGF